MHRLEHIMGMPIGIELPGDEVDSGAFDAAFDWFRWVDATFSTYKEDSEISRLNRNELTVAEAHPEVQWVLRRCAELLRETDGYFDASAAGGGEGSVDPSGLVKGWAIDRAADLLEARGIASYSVNAGGDIRLRGGPVPGKPWRVGIRHPIEHDKVAAVAALSGGGIATSGEYERGRHIVNPHTGAPPDGVLSVTITGPVLADADAYATAVFAMGPAGAQWAASLAPQYQAMVILADGRVLSTPDFPRAPLDG